MGWFSAAGAMLRRRGGERTAPAPPPRMALVRDHRGQLRKATNAERRPVSKVEQKRRKANRKRSRR